MNDAAAPDTNRMLKRVAIAAVLIVVAVFASRAIPARLWLDELYTVTLLKADSLPKLWEGIVLGIDGNPPLYLTLAWLIAQAVPAWATVAVLKFVNLVLTAAALLALYRLARRAASRQAACGLSERRRRPESSRHREWLQPSGSAPVAPRRRSLSSALWQRSAGESRRGHWPLRLPFPED